jgi:hypothetical protein
MNPVEYEQADYGKAYQREIRGKAKQFPRGQIVPAGAARGSAADKYLGRPNRASAARFASVQKRLSQARAASGRGIPLATIERRSADAGTEHIDWRAGQIRREKGVQAAGAYLRGEPSPHQAVGKALPKTGPGRIQGIQGAKKYTRRADLKAAGFPNPRRVERAVAERVLAGGASRSSRALARASRHLGKATIAAAVGEAVGVTPRVPDAVYTGMDVGYLGSTARTLGKLAKAGVRYAPRGAGLYVAAGYGAANIAQAAHEAKLAAKAAKHGETHAQAAGKWGVKVETPQGWDKLKGMLTGQYETKVTMPKVNYSLRRSPDKFESWRTSKGDTYILPSRMSINEGYTKSFKEAFAEARKKKGPHSTFEWKGQKYTTKYRDEK